MRANGPKQGQVADSSEESTPGTIVELVTGDPTFSTLLGAIRAAGIAETLSGKGPYTMFAPSNAAFAKIDPAVLNGLLMPEQQATLARILTTHVIAGETTSAEIVDRIERADEDSIRLMSVNGTPLTASLVDGNLVLTDANGTAATIVTTDVEAGNGLVHIIDRVLMP